MFTSYKSLFYILSYQQTANQADRNIKDQTSAEYCVKLRTTAGVWRRVAALNNSSLTLHKRINDSVGEVSVSRHSLLLDKWKEPLRLNLSPSAEVTDDIHEAVGPGCTARTVSHCSVTRGIRRLKPTETGDQ